MGDRNPLADKDLPATENDLSLPVAGEGGVTLLSDPERVRSDARMLQTAIRNRWDIPAALMASLPKELRDIVEQESRPRERLRAIEALIAMNAQNIQIDQKQDDHNRIDRGQATEEIRHTFRVSFQETRDNA